MTDILLDEDMKSRKKLGEILVDKGVLREVDLQHALELQNQEKSILGKILIGENYIRNQELHQAIAERFGLEFVDLTMHQPDYKLFDAGQRHEYFALELVPFSQTPLIITLAVTNIDDDIKKWAAKNYPDREIKFIITSPYDIRHVLQKKFSVHNDEEARLKLWKQKPSYSARRLFLSNTPNIVAAIVLAGFALSLIIPPIFAILIGVMNGLFTAAVTFKNLFFIKGWRKSPIIEQEPKEYAVYTILLPLYQETATLPKLIDAIQRLEYPKSKLDVKFVVEVDDILTINAIKRLHPPQYMEIIQVPFSLPRTKPKACNYALNFARGEFITIYDAEDVPDKNQLRAVLNQFQNNSEKLACVQARLNYYNYKDNQLTRWFALEYAIWFDSVIKGLDRAAMPIPLGGTSNHVRTSILRKIGGWDAFNVTEDADLGLRLAQEGYRTETIDSLTMEEAPNNLRAWIKQRTRWIKGFMQTYFVHMRDVGQLIKNTGIGGFLSLQFFIGIPILIYLTAPVLIIASTVLTLSGSPAGVFPGWLKTFCWANLAYGVASNVLMCLASALKAHRPNGRKLFRGWMLFSSLTFYVYGLLYVIAAFRALYQLVTDPHYWDKTQHGLAKTGA